MAKVRPTFKQLRESASKIGPEAVEVLDKMEVKCIRLIQLLSEVKELEKEIGYTDQHSGERHKGLRDEVEKEFIVYNLFDGIQIEDFVLSPITGSGPDWVDPIELLRLGVPDETIKAATRPGRGWTSVRVQKIKRKEHIGGAKF